jgi:hypothetical protein
MLTFLIFSSGLGGWPWEGSPYEYRIMDQRATLSRKIRTRSFNIGH